MLIFGSSGTNLVFGVVSENEMLSVLALLEHGAYLSGVVSNLFGQLVKVIVKIAIDCI